ncbi:hypothetical protein K438DRAFT_785004 [Mycena galopus ATCC 62051]|nr:hypothetical protein K438DRAFT_785004 [Mycena galopus ATCC 62051]
MRRIASVFRSKDKERTVVPLAPTPPPVPSLTSELGSSASSNGSALHTPNDDLVLTRTATRSKSWTAWLGKKSGTIKRRPPDQDTPLDQGWVDPVPDRRMKQPTLILHAPPTPKSLPQPPKVDIHIDSDEDASSLGSDDAEAASHSAPALHPPITPTSVAQSRKNLEILIQNSLVPPLATSTPFSHLPGLPMYPRSSNPPQSLPARQTMQSVMHRSLLLRRLQPDVSTLSVAQQQLDRSILPLASRPPPTPVDPPPPLQWFNDRALPAAMTLSPSSSGLRRWMARPCFEERIAVWVPLNGVVACQPVTGSSCAVADLEYSAALDAMIGFGLAPVEEEASSPVAVAPVPTTQQPQPAAAAVRNTAYHAIPSPLRNSALKPKSAPKSPISETPPSSATSPDFLAPPTPPAAPAPTVSRVRFVEDDKDNVIPLGYTLRLKKKREEKAKFLREEQERRAHEEERAKQEAERLKREQERNQWEEEKRAWEKEQRAMEEERKRRFAAPE